MLGALNLCSLNSIDSIRSQLSPEWPLACAWLRTCSKGPKRRGTASGRPSLFPLVLIVKGIGGLKSSLENFFWSKCLGPKNVYKLGRLFCWCHAKYQSSLQCLRGFVQNTTWIYLYLCLLLKQVSSFIPGMGYVDLVRLLYITEEISWQLFPFLGGSLLTSVLLFVSTHFPRDVGACNSWNGKT